MLNKSSAAAQNIRISRISKLYRYKYLYLLLVPVLLYYILFQYVPMYGIIIAFKDFNPVRGFWGSSWVGFAYFEQIFRDSYFWQVTWNTCVISFYKLVFYFPMPIILAVLLNEIAHQRFKRIVQTIIYLPHFVSWVILGGIIFSFLSVYNGVINEIIGWFGAEPINFLLKQDYFRPILVISEIWKSTGWGTIIYLAAITGINSELYEAAIVDGANKWKQMLHITLPGIRPSIVIMFILALSSLLNAGFDQVFVLYNPAVYDVGDIIDTYVYRLGLVDARYSYATAVGLFKGVIALIIILAADRLFKANGDDGLI